ncbi:MAG TPA: ribbon-helix-helix protein, CopG family [Rhizomicrobium sp.]|jgi:predicted transcriptional regulator|nr:ribbon-helix-helix protein, CopG family [Rhizomicrobium sp.]
MAPAAAKRPAAKSVTVTARIPAALAKKLAVYAKTTKRTRSWLIENILGRYVEHEIAFAKFVQEGIDAADRGELISHEEAVRQLREHIAKRKSERRKAA